MPTGSGPMTAAIVELLLTSIVPDLAEGPVIW